MLAREALRLATVRALRGNTWVGDRVHDSEHGPADDRADEETLPLIVVYTDDVKASGDDEGDLLAGGTVKLAIEILITSRMRVKVEGTEDEAYQYDCPQTDAGMELTIGIIERQIRVALSNPNNPWGDLWHKLAKRFGDVSSMRGTSMREGVRFAGRQLTMDIEVPKDPVPGASIGPTWVKFLELVDQAADLAPVRPMLHALVEGSALPLTGADVLRAAYGLSSDVARALQILPPAGVTNDPSFTGLPAIDDQAVEGD